jgi:hypothetical protein
MKIIMFDVAGSWMGQPTVRHAIRTNTFDVTGTVSADDGMRLQDVELVVPVETPFAKASSL